MEQDKPLFRVEITPQTKEYFTDASKWGRTVAIIGFCGIGLLLIVFLFLGSQLSIGFEEIFATGDEGAWAGVIIFTLVVVLGIVGVLCYFLYRGSTKIRAGVVNSDQASFNEGIAHLKNYFLMLGILSLIALILNLFKFL